MKPLMLAGLAGLASLGAQAQTLPYGPTTTQSLEQVIVTATRSLAPTAPTLRDAQVITRDDLDRAGNLSLAEVLQRQAGVEFRATGGAGQPTGLFLRGANTGHTLVLIDGVRVMGALGSTSVENIPLDMVERIEIVKGPLSSLYGADAIGGVVQVFTRGKSVPHFFAASGFGTDNEGRVSAGLTGADANTSFSLNLGGRKVDAPSATNERNFCHDADRDPYENLFFSARGNHRMWQGELLSVTTFVTKGRTHFDGCTDNAGNRYDDLNQQWLYGVGLASESQFTDAWKSRLAYNYGRDDIRVSGAFPSIFETQQEQVSWVNELTGDAGNRLLLGAEALRQRIVKTSRASPFAKDEREIYGAFAGFTQAYAGGERFEANVRADRDRDSDRFGTRTTGSASYGFPLGGFGYLSGTYGTGYRAPTFFDLYGPSSDFYQPNPNLQPERSRSAELALRGDPKQRVRWKLTAFDNRIEDLIIYVFPTVQNVNRARIRGVEASLDTTWAGIDWRAALTAQRPEDEDTGKRLQGRAERFGTLEATRRFGEAWSAGVTVFGSGERFDSTDEAPSSRLGGYAVVDARVRYKISQRWSAEVTATNLFDRKHESAVGYDAPRRGVMLNVRFEAF